MTPSDESDVAAPTVVESAYEISDAFALLVQRVMAQLETPSPASVLPPARRPVLTLIINPAL
jgi:hypothetical protein